MGELMDRQRHIPLTHAPLLAGGVMEVEFALRVVTQTLR